MLKSLLLIEQTLKYVRLESIYRSNGLISNLLIFAAEDQARPIAIAIPAQAALLSFAQENGFPTDNFEKLVYNERIKSLVLKELQETGRKADLAHFEIIEGLVLTDTEWTPQNVGLAFLNTRVDYADNKCRGILHPRRS